jgi:type I restriction enzyme S subunit
MSDEEDYALMIRTTNFTKNDFKNNVKYVSKYVYDFFKKSQIFGGEIIMNKIGSAGDFWLMPYLNRPVSLGLNQFVIRLKDINTLYFYYFLSTDYGSINIKSRTNGAATKSITKTAVRDLPILVPPIELQNEFADKIALIEQQKVLAKQELQESEDLFNCLLQQAFKGEMV